MVLYTLSVYPTAKKLMIERSRKVEYNTELNDMCESLYFDSMVMLDSVENWRRPDEWAEAPPLATLNNAHATRLLSLSLSARSQRSAHS